MVGEFNLAVEELGIQGQRSMKERWNKNRPQTHRLGMVNLSGVVPSRREMGILSLGVAGSALWAADTARASYDALNFAERYDCYGNASIALLGDPAATVTIVAAGDAVALNSMHYYAMKEVDYQDQYIGMYFSGTSNGLAPRVIRSRARSYIHSQLELALIQGRMSDQQYLKYENVRSLDDAIPIWFEIRCRN